MNTHPHRLATLLTAAAITVVGCRNHRQDEVTTRIDGSIFGTNYRIDYHGGADAGHVQAAVDAELDRIDWIASTWKPQSELMRYNRSADPHQFALSPELAMLLERSAEIERMTGGAFNVRFQPGQVDLSAIAKGYAVDRVAKLLTERFGITSCMVDIGGEIKVCGPGPRGDTWHIGLYLPTPPGHVATTPPLVELRDTSIATSGTYFRGPHIIDPRAGKAVDHDLVSASVIHPSNTMADALATALYVMGPDEGIPWARAHGIHAIFLFKDGHLMECTGGPATNNHGR